MSATQFQQDQFESIYPPGVERNYWSKARVYIIKDFLRKQGLKRKRMLEIGCGRGIVLKELRLAGFDSFGVELAPVSVDEDLKGNLFSGIGFEELDLKLRESVEVILLFDVIEHIEDDLAFLKKINIAFPNLSHVVMTVPARMELWSNFDVYCGHFRRYTGETLRQLITAAGCVPLSTSYFFHSLFLPAWLYTVLKLQRATSMRVPKKFESIVHAWLALVFFIEYKVVPTFVWGSSLIVCIKSNNDSK